MAWIILLAFALIVAIGGSGVVRPSGIAAALRFATARRDDGGKRVGTVSHPPHRTLPLILARLPRPLARPVSRPPPSPFPI